MSFQDDLARNRQVYSRLSTGVSQDVEARQTAPDAEGALLSPEQFMRSVERMNRENNTPVYSLDAPAPLQDGTVWQEAPAGDSTPRQAQAVPQMDSPVRRWQQGDIIRGDIAVPRVTRMLGDGAEVHKVEYPGTASTENTDGSEDLLDNLLRRIEAGARRYPQDLGAEGGSTW